MLRQRRDGLCDASEDDKSPLLLQCPVHAIRLRLKTLAWVALVAMVGLALGPSISRALAANAPGFVAVHVSPMEMGPHAHAAAGMTGGHIHHHDTPTSPSDTLECCALCALASSALAIVVFVAPDLERGDPATVPEPRHAVATPRAREFWSSPAPRGPPLLA